MKKKGKKGGRGKGGRGKGEEKKGIVGKGEVKRGRGRGGEKGMKCRIVVECGRKTVWRIQF